MTELMPALRSRVLALVLAFALAGCATANVDKGFSFDSSSSDDAEDAETGLLIGSVSSRSDSNLPSLSSTFYFRAMDRSFTGIIKTGDVAGTLGLVSHGSDLPYAKGQIFAIELPAGSYTFSGWYISTGTVAISSDRDQDDIPFVIHADRATYVGNVNMHVRIGRNIFGLPILSGGDATITDRSRHDLPIILARYRNLQRDDIDIVIPDDAAWHNLGGTKDVYIP